MRKLSYVWRIRYAGDVLAVSSKRAVRTKKNVGVGHMYVDCISEIYV